MGDLGFGDAKLVELSLREVARLGARLGVIPFVERNEVEDDFLRRFGVPERSEVLEDFLRSVGVPDRDWGVPLLDTEREIGLREPFRPPIGETPRLVRSSEGRGGWMG